MAKNTVFKRYYVESKLRFSAFIIFLIILTTLIISSIMGGTVHGAAIEKAYYAITVAPGDTLWSIAERYSDSDTDIRKFIYEISDINYLDSSDLIIGQQLIIPA